MSTDITSGDFVAASTNVLDGEEAALQTAHAQAVAELNRLRDKASVDDTASADGKDYSLHEVAGIGKYVIPRRTGWQALLDIIHDPVPNIDFSANIYPAFDGIIIKHFDSKHLYDPLDDQYESRKFFSLHPGHKPYEDLRDNLAAVRNFLMQSYYANSPEGMTPEKAKQAMAEIAAFVGDGLYNNWLFMGILPNHKLGEPFIDIKRAQEPGGKGAQYIYEKILEHQRHSSWMHPFDMVAEMLGWKKRPDWKLPAADNTHFTDFFERDIAPGASTHDLTIASMQTVTADIAALEARMDAVRDAKALTTSALDIDNIGNHLVYTATNMEEGVAQLNDSVRRDAVEIAKDILRKLKLSIGGIFTVDGLKMKPTDDMAALGAIKGVATVYERLLAWARNNNDAGILQHPSVIAATQAIGQLGYQAKREALRMASLAGNRTLAKAISEQIDRLPQAYASQAGVRFGDLLDHVERGIDTILNRTQQVSVTGAKVGFSVDSSLGTSISAPPTAGGANQVGVDHAASRNAQAAQADQLAAQAQAQRIHAQLATQTRAQQAQGQPQQTAQPASRSGSTVGRQSLQAAQDAKKQQRPVNTSTTAPVKPSAAPLNAAQQQAAARQATAEALAQARRREEQIKLQLQQTQQQLALRDAQMKAAKAAAQKIDPNLLKGFQNANNTKGLMGAPITGGKRIDPKTVQASTTKPPAGTTPKPPQTEEEKRLNPYGVQPPAPPPRTPGGRGF